MHIARGKLTIPESEFKLTFARSSGPGGQNVNKVNSKATLRWDVSATPSLPPEIKQRFLVKYRQRLTAGGELVLTSQRFRDQRRNVDDCRDRLARMIESVVDPPKRRKPTRPTAASRVRRAKEKRRTSERKRSRRETGAED